MRRRVGVPAVSRRAGAYIDLPGPHWLLTAAVVSPCVAECSVAVYASTCSSIFSPSPATPLPPSSHRDGCHPHCAGNGLCRHPHPTLCGGAGVVGACVGFNGGDAVAPRGGPVDAACEPAARPNLRGALVRFLRGWRGWGQSVHASLVGLAPIQETRRLCCLLREGGRKGGGCCGCNRPMVEATSNGSVLLLVRPCTRDNCFKL